MRNVLAIDIGNTYTKLGFFIDGVLEETERIVTESNDPATLEAELNAINFASLSTIDFVVIASVVPQITDLFQQILGHAFPPDKILWLTEAHLQHFSHQIDFSAYSSQQLGMDRIANMVSCSAQFPMQLRLVCDFGTTATFDLMDDVGRYLGGAIMPGARGFQSLVHPKRAAQLFEVDIFNKPIETPGTSTAQCLANGLYYGYKGAILEILGNLFQAVQWPFSQVNIIFTGGDAHAVRDMLTTELPTVHIDEGLTLKGLYAFAIESQKWVAI